MNPYLIQGPAIISFSMGRTSAFMLKQIIDAHGGQLPPDVHVVTSNTGKEDPKSLRFGHECATRWGFDWHLIEYRDDDVGFERVGLNSASMNGEPFDALIARMGFVPNRDAPYCSIVLKARTIRDYVRAIWGWQNWTSVLGIRHDEPMRVLSAAGRNASGKDPWRNLLPLDQAKVAEATVLTYFLGPNWERKIHELLTVHPSLPQGFDLGLLRFQGNCDLCWKKSRGKRMALIRANPDVAIWWSDHEQQLDRHGEFTLFREDEPVASLVRDVARSPLLPLDIEEEREGTEEECGFTCFLSDADRADL